jgi:hypothetical protein
MKTSRLSMALFAAAGLGLGGGAQAQSMTRADHDVAYKIATSQYKMDREACNSLSGNAKDVCVEEAKGKEKVAKAEADASYKGTAKSREDARLARAEADYSVAKEKCDDAAGNAKAVCVKEAKATYVRAKADARVDRVAADTHNAAAEKTAEARRDALDEKRGADYKVAIEKCDGLAGTAKDTCVQNAKMRYGKS